MVPGHRAGAPMVARRPRRDGGVGRGQLVDHDLCGSETSDQCHWRHRHTRRLCRRKRWHAPRHAEWRRHHRHDPALMVDERGHRQPRTQHLARRWHPCRDPGRSRDRPRRPDVRLERTDREFAGAGRDVSPPARRDQGLGRLDRPFSQAGLSRATRAVRRDRGPHAGHPARWRGPLCHRRRRERGNVQPRGVGRVPRIGYRLCRCPGRCPCRGHAVRPGAPRDSDLDPRGRGH